ncbi:MAG: hypothetical protein M1533_02100 [Candidatus Thermoplasmatota archaeon]|jgi:hypothetical protein|nr:hypothetical protein [Candidatus Thermoplasmatota archaeon]MCL5794348.1 hypothetical protein [Candidatus Thermoplasmatota archaeon]
MDKRARYVVIVAIVLIVVLSISVDLLINHPEASSGGSLNVTFSPNGNTTGTDSVTAGYNLVVNPVNPTSMDEYHISMYVNSTETSAVTGSYSISWASNPGVQTKSSGHSVVWVSSNAGPGYVVFFANSGTETVSTGAFLDVFYGDIVISGSNVSVNPVSTSTWSGVTIDLSYSGYSGMAGVTL